MTLAWNGSKASTMISSSTNIKLRTVIKPHMKKSVESTKRMKFTFLVSFVYGMLGISYLGIIAQMLNTGNELFRLKIYLNKLKKTSIIKQKLGLNKLSRFN